MLRRAAGLGTAPGDGDNPCCLWSSAALTCVGAQPQGAGGAAGGLSLPLGSVIPSVTQARGGEVSERQKGFLFSRCFIMGLLVPKRCFELIW